MCIVHKTVIYSIYRYNVLFKSLALQTYMFCGGGHSFTTFGDTMMQGRKLPTKLLTFSNVFGCWKPRKNRNKWWIHSDVYWGVDGAPLIYLPLFLCSTPLCQSIFKYPALLIQHRAPGVRTVGGKMELTVVRLSGEETVLTVQEVWLYRGQSAGWILGS